jgi:1-deoxy-D-xylulose-5-phosphate reductoisomerase
LYEITAHISAGLVKRRLTILGSTGSVGRQALDVVRDYSDRFEVVGLSASQNADLLVQQAAEFEPELVALESGQPPSSAGFEDCEVLTGPGSAEHLAALPTDVVLNAIVGFAGLAATVRALEAGNRLALANKESLVAGGEWVMGLAGDNHIIPVDSEHSAIFQCLEGRGEEASGILLTASGGPFFGFEKARLLEVGPEDALRHPTWRMGPKITIDSATMMNKGLEVIEAHHLFGVPYEEVRVVVHRQSVVHGGVFFVDGSAVLHSALPDMRLPIAYAILYPERVDVGVEPVPLGGVSWTFEEPRDDLFRCLPLAVEAGRAGGAYPVALNAANEVAVEAFLAGRVGFLQIAGVIEEVLDSVPDFGAMLSLEAISSADAWAREKARRQTREVALP